MEPREGEVGEEALPCMLKALCKVELQVVELVNCSWAEILQSVLAHRR